MIEAYADDTYYKGDFGGKVIPDAELGSYLQKATMSIDILTSNQIRGNGLATLTPYQLDLVKMAVCTQAEHLYTYGDMPANLTGYSVNGNSVSIGGKVDMRYSRQAVDYLKMTGLTYRGIFSSYSGAYPYEGV